MRRSVLALALCALLALAGCNGLLPGADPTTTTGTGPSPDSYPPGLVSNGVSSADALATAHGDGLAATSYATRQTVTASRNGSAVWTSTVSKRVAPDRRSYRVHGNDTGSLPNAGTTTFTAWSNGSGPVYRYQTEDGHGYARRNTTVHQWWSTNAVYSFYLALFFDVNHTDDGFTLVATDIRTPEPVSTRFTNPSNVSLTMHLDDDGVVHAYRLAYDGTLRDTRYHVVETFELTQVGGVTVEKPPWVDEALNQTD